MSVLLIFGTCVNTDAHTGKIAGWKEDEWIQSLLMRPGGQGLRAVWVLKGDKLGAIRCVQCWKHMLRVSMQRGGWPMSWPSSDCINLRMRMQNSRKWGWVRGVVRPGQVDSSLKNIYIIVNLLIWIIKCIRSPLHLPHRGSTAFLPHMWRRGRKESGLRTLEECFICHTIWCCGEMSRPRNYPWWPKIETVSPI